MEIVITLIGTVIGAVIGWNWNHLTKNDKFLENKRKEKKEEVISSELIAENKDYRIYKCHNRDTNEHIGYLLFNIQDRYPDLFRGTLQDFGEYITSKYNIESLEVYGDTIKFNT